MVNRVECVHLVSYPYSTWSAEYSVLMWYLTLIAHSQQSSVYSCGIFTFIEHGQQSRVYSCGTYTLIVYGQQNRVCSCGIFTLISHSQ